MATESEIMSQEEVESALRMDEAEQQPKNGSASPFVDQQPSIYSLTIDEFQNKLHEGNKNFGSMNMDEFLNSIWTAEENQAHTTAVANTTTTAPTVAVITGSPFPNQEGTSTQPSLLARQASLTLPPPLCQKTVDEVWLEINRTEQQQDQQQQQYNSRNLQNPDCPQRQATFGEMTLEDFLVKAGVVRERGQLPLPPQPPPPSPYVPYPNTSNPVVGPRYITRSVMGLGTSGTAASVPGYPSVLAPSGIVGEAQSYIGSGSTKRGGAYQRPVSPVSVDGPGLSQVDSSNQYGLDKGGMRGGQVAEKVVERRQRRMIKNRESAARARARKQAYTVELEAELNQLKEENANLKQALAELDRKRKQQCFEEVKLRTNTKAQKAKEKFQMIRRNMSCPY